MEAFTLKVIRTIKSIPPGKVMTYGQIAAHAGSPRAARQVARLLHSMSAKYDLPWHRVVNAAGIISIQDKEHQLMQREMLQNEGIEFTGLEIDLIRFRFDPEQD